MRAGKQLLTPEERAARRLAFRISWKGTLLDCLLLALSGCFFTTAFPGVDFQLAAWIGIIPLVALCAGRTVPRAFCFGLVWGYFWNLTSCFFLREIAFFIPFVFAFVLGLFTACFAAPIPFLFHFLLYPKKIRQGGFSAVSVFHGFSPLREILCTFTLAAWWTCLEWIRSWIFTGFPWNLAAVTQWRNENFIQICEFTGIYGISFLLVFFNVAVYFALRGFRYSIPEGRYKRPWAFLCAVTMCLAAAWAGARTYVLRKAEYKPENLRFFSVGIVQPHLSQRRAGGFDAASEALNVCCELTERLIADDRVVRSGAVREIAAMTGDSLQLRPDDTPDRLRDVLPLELIVWPESAVPAGYYGIGTFGTLYRKQVRALLAKSGVPLLLGTTTCGDVRSETDFDICNSALLLKDPGPGDPDPCRDMHSVYSKVHLVPYGEFVPLANSFPILRKLTGMGLDLTPGKGFFPLEPARDVRAGTLICYEDVFPYAARAQAQAGANMLLVITNDAWYPTSFEPVQHCANALFRTIETRLPMLRCGNSDYSVLIDPRGNIIDSVFSRADPETGELLPDPGRKGSGTAKFIVPVPRKHKPTFYTTYGDVFVLFCWILAAAGFLAALISRLGDRKRFGESVDDRRKRLRESFLAGK